MKTFYHMLSFQGRLWVSILLIACSTLLFSQNVVTIGTGVSTTFNAPLYISSGTSTNKYSQCAMLYTYWEIGAVGNITRIAWYKGNAEGYGSSDASLSIYMKTTPAVSIGTAAGTFDAEKQGASLVYSRTNQSLPLSSGWMELVLDNPYPFDGTGGLMILVDWFRPNNATGAVTWRFTNAPGQSITWSGVGPNPGSLYNNGSRPNVQLTFVDPLANDAGIKALRSPISPVAPGTSPIVVDLRNYGTDTLYSAMLNWSIDGVVQTPFPWLGVIPPSEQDSFILIGSHLFSLGSSLLKVWSSFPNGIPDSNQNNDTLAVNITCLQPLSGTYTVGGALSDFQDMATALQLLHSSGINGPVNFMIQPGMYEENWSIGSIPGADQDNSVTFQSATLNPADVIIQYNANNDNDNFVIMLDGTSYVSIDNLTIKSLDSVFARALVIGGGSHYNIISNNIVECQPEARTSYRSGGIYSPLTKDNFNIISGNIVRNAYQGIYLFGPSTGDPELGNMILNNLVEDSYYQGIYCQNQRDLAIERNRIRSYPTPVNSFSLTANACNQNLVIRENQIVELGQDQSYGLRVVNSNAGTSTNSLICNNYVLQAASSPSNAWGLMIETSNHQRVYHNTVILRGQTGNSRAAQFMSGSNNRSVNNLFVHLGGGFALVVNNSPFALSNHNTYWTTGTVLALHQGVIQTSLASLQASISQDYQSLYVDPGLAAPQYFIPTNSQVDNAGIALPDVAFDLAGLARDPVTPDPGAYEFAVFSNDAGIISIDSPGPVTSPGQHAIAVSIQNFGIDTIYSLGFYTQLDTNTAVHHAWTGILLPQEVITHVSAGNQYFDLGESTLTAWTTLPNGNLDPNPSNDSLQVQVKVCYFMSGTYTIGDTANGADYASFTDAISALDQCGVDGPVTFAVEPGYYFEQIRVGSIHGASQANRITFASSTGNAEDVVVAFQPTQVSQDWVFYFENSGFFRLDKISMQIEQGSVSGKCVRLSGTSSIEIIDCRLILPPVNNPGLHGVFSNGSADSLLLIQGNTISGGYTSVTLRGPSSLQPQPGNNILDNRLLNFSGHGISMYFQQAPGIHGNLIQASAAPGDCIGLDLYALIGGYRVERNRIQISGIAACTGILLRYSNGDSLDRALVSNNFITIEPTSNNNSGGLSIAVVGKTDIFHNSIHCASPRGPMLFGSLCESIRIINNIFFNPGMGTAFYCPGISSLFVGLDVMDFNCYYTNGPSLIYVGADFANLSAWQNTGADTNSISLNPQFISNVLLYPTNPGLDNAGAGVPEVTTDIDGRVRDAISPDPGAVEFTTANNDAGVFAIVRPLNPAEPGYHPITIRLTNAGINPLTSCTISYRIDSAAFQSFSWAGYVAPLSQSDTITIGGHVFASGQHLIKVYTSNPNGAQDEVPLNDTLEQAFNFCWPYAGTYTIDAVNANADFSSVSEAMTALMSCGVSDSVILEIATGAYNEQVNIGHVPGASIVKPVIIRSASMNPGDVILHHSPVNLVSNYVINLDGANFVSIQHISIVADSGTAYGRAVTFRNDSKHNSLIGNIIKAPSKNSPQYACIFSEGGSDDFTLIKNNQIIGGGYGIYWLGESNANREVNCSFLGNTLLQQVNTSIFTSFQSGIVIENNVISNSGIAVESSGIHISKSTMPKIASNEVVLSGSEKNYPLRIDECVASANQPGQIINNILVQSNYQANPGNALWVRKTSHHHYVYNTLVVVSPQSPAALSLQQLQDSNVFLNNQLIHQSGGYCLWMANAGSLSGLLAMDHNNFFTTGSKLGYLGYPVGGLAQWRVVSGFDANSISHDPVFMSASGYAPTSTLVNDRGTPVAGITHDIYGNSRDLIQPDIGAIEFDPIIDDVGLVGLQVLAGICDLGSETLRATLVNYGSQTVASNSISIQLQRPGGQITQPEWIPDSIPSLDTVFYTLQNTIDLSSSYDTSILITGWLNYPMDVFPINDTFELKVFSLNTPPPPQPGNATVPYGDTATLKVTNPLPGVAYQWYTVGGNTPFATSDSIRILPSYFDTVFFVSAIARYQECFIAGPESPSFGSFMSGNDPGYFLEFDVTAEGGIYLDSVDIYPTSYLGAQYEIIVKQGNVLVYSKSASTSVTPFSRERVALGCHIPEGQGYSIGFSTNPGMVYNTDGAAYPYQVPHVIRITGNSGSPFQYPWFYNLKVRVEQLACESAKISDTLFVLLPAFFAADGFDSTICFSDTVDIGGYAIGGIPPYAYNWTPTNGLLSPNAAYTAAFPLNTTIYTQMVTDLAGQVAYASYTLNVAPLPLVQLTLPFDSMDISNQAVSLSGGIPAGGTYSGPGVSAGHFDPAIAGIGLHYILYHYQDPQSGCQNVAFDTVLVGNWSAINEHGKPELSIYPNPSTGEVELFVPDNHYYRKLQVRNQLGQMVMELPLKQVSRIRIDLSQLSPGVFFISILGEGHVITRRIILASP